MHEVCEPPQGFLHSSEVEHLLSMHDIICHIYGRMEDEV